MSQRLVTRRVTSSLHVQLLPRKGGSEARCIYRQYSSERDPADLPNLSQTPPFTGSSYLDSAKNTLVAQQEDAEDDDAMQWLLSKTTNQPLANYFTKMRIAAAKELRLLDEWQARTKVNLASERFKKSLVPSAWSVSVAPGDDFHHPASRERVYLTHPEHEDPLVLDRHWLRDECQCAMCVNPHSGQKNYGTCDVPDDLPVKYVRKTAEGNLEVAWENDFLHQGQKTHVSQYPASMVDSFFGRVDEGTIKWQLQQDKVVWDKHIFTRDQKRIPYDDWMAGPSSAGFLGGLAQLKNYGLLFLDGVPKSEESVVKIAQQIGNLQETLYGRTWDVRSKPKAENVAYTSSFLGLHQDLLYTADPPRIQLLHCLDNSCEGGESLFSDGVRAGITMKFGPSHLYKPLNSKRIVYRYNKNGHYYERMRPVLCGLLPSVYWSPPFQGNLQVCHRTGKGSEMWRAWLRAARKFKELIEAEQWMYEYKMKEGECVLFDNLRVLHGRRQFDTSAGSRWLKGAYIAGDVYTSKLAVLRNKLAEAACQARGDEKLPHFDEQVIQLAYQYNVWEGFEGFEVRERM